MKQWWEVESQQLPGSVPTVRAVAYYRHSAQDRQENSIPIQREQVREWATKNGVEIIHEFADAGKSGLNAEGRPAFTEMMEEWVRSRRYGGGRDQSKDSLCFLSPSTQKMQVSCRRFLSHPIRQHSCKASISEVC
jgi:hypothetical protein